MNNITDNGQIIQLVEASDPSDGNLHVQQPEILYISEDSLLTTENISQFQVAEDSNLVETQVIDFEELITQDGEPFILDNVNQNSR